MHTYVHAYAAVGFPRIRVRTGQRRYRVGVLTLRVNNFGHSLQGNGRCWSTLLGMPEVLVI